MSDLTTSLLLVVVFLAPGLVWHVASSFAGGSRRATFDALCGVLLVSLVCNAVAATAMAVLSRAEPSRVLDLGGLVRTGDYYVHRHYGVILTTVAMTAALACVIAALLAIATRHHDHGEVDTTGGLPSLLALGETERTGSARLLCVRSKDGTLYQGGFDAIDDDRGATGTITLRGPIVFRRLGADAETMPPEWDRLALSLAEVAEVWARSTPVPAPVPTPAPAAAPRSADVSEPGDEGCDTTADLEERSDDVPEHAAGVPNGRRRARRPERAAAVTAP